MTRKAIPIFAIVTVIVFLCIGLFIFRNNDTATIDSNTDTSIKLAITDNLVLENSTNINPGDGSNSTKSTSTENNEHPLTFGIVNIGQKPIKTRNIIDIKVSNSQGNFNLDPNVLHIYEKTDQGYKELGNGAPTQANRIIYTDETGTRVLRYVIDGASLNSESTKEENKDIINKLNGNTITVNKSETKANYKYYLGIDSFYNKENDESKENTINDYVGAGIDITVTIEAIPWKSQDNNLTNEDWQPALNSKITTSFNRQFEI